MRTQSQNPAVPTLRALAAGNHPESGKRVDTALTRLKSRYGAIAKQDNGKWYRTTGSSDFHGQTA